jgi:hypothetical protein
LAEDLSGGKIGGITNYFVEQSWDLMVQSIAYLKTLNVLCDRLPTRQDRRNWRATGSVRDHPDDARRAAAADVRPSP